MNIKDIWQGEVPTKLIVGLVKSQAYNGDYHLNPFHFQHFDISDIGFFVNGEATPCPAYKLDLENGIYLQGLNSLYKITTKTMENSDIGITRETYQQGYTLIGFDVDPTTSPDFRYVGKPCEGHTKLDIRFKKGLSSVTVILYATFPENMTIDQARNVRLEIKDKFVTKKGTFSIMNTKQLSNALCLNPTTTKYFDGIYSADTLKEIREKPDLIICNTDPSNKPGEHRVLFFL